MGVSKTNDHIQIKMKMSNPSQEPPVISKAQNEDLKADEGNPIHFHLKKIGFIVLWLEMMDTQLSTIIRMFNGLHQKTAQKTLYLYSKE